MPRTSAILGIVAAAGAALATALACQSPGTQAAPATEAAQRFRAAEAHYAAAREQVPAAVAGDAVYGDFLARVERRAAAARAQGQRALAMRPSMERERLLEVATFRMEEATGSVRALLAAAERRDS